MRYELTKDLETGNALIDREHRELFKAVNDLLDACTQGKGREQMAPSLNFLTAYVDKHFKDEEQLQVQTEYPGLTAHRQFHEGYKRQLGAVVQDIQGQGPTIAILSKFNQLVGVLINHIRQEDKQLAVHVKAKAGL